MNNNYNPVEAAPAIKFERGNLYGDKLQPEQGVEVVLPPNSQVKVYLVPDAAGSRNLVPAVSFWEPGMPDPEVAFLHQVGRRTTDPYTRRDAYMLGLGRSSNPAGFSDGVLELSSARVSRNHGVLFVDSTGYIHYKDGEGPNSASTNGSCFRPFPHVSFLDHARQATEAVQPPTYRTYELQIPPERPSDRFLPPSPLLGGRLTVIGESKKGLRGTNDDAFSVSEVNADGKFYGVVTLCDGVGSDANGGRAAQIASAEISARFASIVASPAFTPETAFQEAIFQVSQFMSEGSTTVVAALIEDPGNGRVVHIAHAGDSMAYMTDTSGRVSPLNVPHTAYHQLGGEAHWGSIGKRSPLFIIQRYLGHSAKSGKPGVSNSADVTLSSYKFPKGNRLVLISDGIDLQPDYLGQPLSWSGNPCDLQHHHNEIMRAVDALATPEKRKVTDNYTLAIIESN